MVELQKEHHLDFFSQQNHQDVKNRKLSILLRRFSKPWIDTHEGTNAVFTFV
jgi:hypothetical protein